MLNPETVKEIAPKGVLRAAINTGNTVLAQKAPGGGIAGVTVDLATEFARRSGIGLEIVTFTSAIKTFEALRDDAWDFAFLAIEPERAAEIDFTSPYILTDGTYLVREGASFRTPQDLDVPGKRISVGQGSAYDLFLTRNLKHAELIRAPQGGSRAMIDRFVAENLDAAAGVRAWLEAYVAEYSGFRIMEEPFMEIGQAIGVPKGKKLAQAALHSFVEEAKASGFVAASLQRSGQKAKVPAAG